MKMPDKDIFYMCFTGHSDISMVYTPDEYSGSTHMKEYKPGPELQQRLNGRSY